MRCTKEYRNVRVINTERGGRGDAESGVTSPSSLSRYADFRNGRCKQVGGWALRRSQSAAFISCHSGGHAVLTKLHSNASQQGVVFTA